MNFSRKLFRLTVIFFVVFLICGGPLFYSVSLCGHDQGGAELFLFSSLGMGFSKIVVDAARETSKSICGADCGIASQQGTKKAVRKNE